MESDKIPSSESDTEPNAAALHEAVKEVRYCRENQLPVNLVRIARDFGVAFPDLVEAVKALPPMLPVPRRGSP